MRRYSLSGPAQQDLCEIGAHIAQDNVAAALRLVDALTARCQSLAEMPGMGRQRDELAPGLRSFTAAPYLIFYRQIDDGIEVVRVLHGARDIESLFP